MHGIRNTVECRWVVGRPKAPRNVTATLQQCSDTTYNAACATLQHRLFRAGVRGASPRDQAAACAPRALAAGAHAHCCTRPARACARMLVHSSLCVSTVLRAYVCSSMRGPGGLCRCATVRAYRHSRDHCSCCVGSTSGRHSGGLRHGKPRTATDDQVGCREGVCGAPSIRDAPSALHTRALAQCTART